ncbi:PTS transporter subunit EIIC [Paenibacillus sp. FSL R7-0337]|uniref:PTS transporter subunit EIIC n=1 Tax=Paenibacillus sp. FSL R7-0337 TaxID=1926588 RepID=UPI00096F6C46|nr:PTS transporter subunit EIIC [Paenibacillus sp. FSL R7-0337]OMF85120.1 PTS fructose transporter subunit IIB [Paenibacillus sp. FSL R7-0337]
MAQNEKIEKTASEVLKAVGGKDNITTVTHCMTRLRFNLKDESIPNAEDIKKIPGVLGTVNAGGQFQIVIGQTVDQVYKSLTSKGGMANVIEADEDSVKQKKQITLKSIGSAVLDAIAGCLTPLIPLLLAVSMFKLLVAVLGQNMLNVLNESSDLYTLLTLVGDAGFYFFPVVVGYTAAKKFGATPVLAMFLGGIMIHPTIIDIATKGTAFSVLGIPSKIQNYSSTILPVIMSVWVMSYIEKFIKKHLPNTLKSILAPSLTIFIMLPIALTVLGPVGSFLGSYISNGLLGLSGVTGFLGVAIIAALYEFLVISGMHLVLITTLILAFSTNGHEALVMPAAIAASLAVAGMCLGAGLRIKEREQRNLSVGFFVAAIIGGVTEPGLYGVGMRYKRPFIGMIIGGFAGGLYAGLTGVTAYTFIPVASFLSVFGFVGGPMSNLVNGIISAVIAFIVSTIATYFLGFKKGDPLITSNADNR